MNLKPIVITAIFLLLLLFGCTYSIDPRSLSQAPANPSALGTNSGGLNPSSTPVLLSASEVAKHSTAADCWMIISGKVYNVSSFSAHPGGDVYVPFCGRDATQAFATRGGSGGSHSQVAFAWLPSFELGVLNQPASGPGLDAQSQSTAASTSPAGVSGDDDDGGDDD